MLSITRLRGPLIMALFPLKKYEGYIKPAKDPNETPMDRIKKVFVSTDYEPVSKELLTLRSLTLTAGVIGTIVGGLIHTRGTVEKFIENNQATLFLSHFDAQRELQNSFTLQFFKGAFKFGWRAVVFTAIFGFVQLLLTAYDGEPFIWHYIVGGGTSGFLFKLSLGLRGSLVGLIVGSILGGIGGSLSLLAFKLTGVTLDDLHAMEQHWAREKDRKYKEAMAKDLSNEIEKTKLLYEENQKVLNQLHDYKEEENTQT